MFDEEFIQIRDKKKLSLGSLTRKLKIMKITKLLFLFVVPLFLSCEGPAGPPGPPGTGGEPILGQVFEVNANFRPNNNYEYLVEFPSNIEIYDSDVVVAYVLTEVNNGVDVWEPLPQSLFFGDDILYYGFDYTLFDINFFLDGTVNLSLLDPVFTENIIFRVAILPADFAEKIDVNNFDEVLGAINSTEITKLY